MNDRIELAPVALWTGLLPFFVIATTYLMSAVGGHIPLCFPPIEGCTSISSSGRYGLSYFVFKAGIIPSAVLLAAFWILCRRWLLQLGADDGIAPRAMQLCGILAAAFLTLYAVFLGSQGEFYELMRRFGINLFFSFSGLAQILLLSRLWRLNGAGDTEVFADALSVMRLLLLAMLIIGLASIPITNYVAGNYRPRNIVAWNFALLLHAGYIVIWWLWSRTGFSATLGVSR